MTVQRLLAGRYRLEAEIGRGSMGTVYRAYDEVLRRPVAIKEVVFPAGMPVAEVDQVADRTLREARAIAALSHPHVITLFDILTPASGPVIVMELMVARSLAEIIAAHGPVRGRDAAIIGAAVAAGLLAAHSAGITHRDVKPANVLISDDGRIKLTDFGIARSAGEQTLTATGMLLGSPAYISPEVAAGRPATSSADAWGLGALLFATVEGRPPFDRGDAIATLTAVVSDPVPDHPHAGPLEPVIDGLLRKDPAQRMTVADAITQLAAVAGGGVFLPPPADAPRLDLPPAGMPRLDIPPADAPRLDVPPASFLPAGSAGRALPPPPWDPAAGSLLPALPAAAPTRHRWRRIAAVAAVVIVAALAGAAWVLLIARLA